MATRLKLTDEIRSFTTTLADDARLSLPLAAGTTYFLDALIQFKSRAASDFKCALAYTGTLIDALCWFDGTLVQNPGIVGGSAVGPRPFSLNAAWFTTPLTIGIGGADTIGTLGAMLTGSGYFRGLIQTNSAGTLKFQWSQLNLDATDTIATKDSYLSVVPVSALPGTIIIKPTDQNNATTTYITDSALHFPVPANEKLLVEMLFRQSSTNTPRWKHQMPEPGVDFAVGYAWRQTGTAENAQPSSATANVAATFLELLLTDPTPTTNTIASRQAAMFSLTQGPAAADLEVQWAQNVASGIPSIMNKFSWLWYEPIA